MSLDRLIYRYRNAPRYQQVLLAFAAERQELVDTLDQMRDRLNLETQTGALLDGIGDILGAPRPRVSEGEDSAFAFEGPTAGLGFGEGRFVSVGTVFEDATPLPDADYRQFLRAARDSNSSNCSISDLERFFLVALGIPVILGSGHRSIQAVVPRPLRAYELRIVQARAPIRAGVELELTVDPDFIPLLNAVHVWYIAMHVTVPNNMG